MEWLTIVLVLAVSRTGALPPGDVLGALDTARSVAFEKGRPELLDHVYLPDSALLRDDRALIDSYERRGVDIERMRMRLLDAKVVESGPDRVRLDVTDRLGESRVRLRDGTVRELPRDQPTRRVVELTLTEDGWRISRITLRR